MGKSALHDWHDSVFHFSQRREETLVFPAYSTTFGGNFDEVRSDVTLPKDARSVVVRRAVNALTPDEWKDAQAAFDASDEGKALASVDPGERREHCEIWLLRELYESDHPELPVHGEIALQKVLEHHAHPDKVAAHKTRLVDSIRSFDVDAFAGEVQS